MSIRTTVLPVLMTLVGVAVLVRTLIEGGGATAVGILMGVLLILAGGLRLWAERRLR
jgi:hypothetical protein